VSVLYYDLAADVSKSIVSGDTLIGVPQNEVLATYSLWRDEKDYRINWLSLRNRYFDSSTLWDFPI
jgi:methionyl-tRNA formyltransferase